MRYLKTYKIFESSDFNSIKDDINDMLLEVSDEGLSISMSETEHHTMSKAFELRITKGQSITEDEYYGGSLYDLDGFTFNDVVEGTLCRILKYLEENGWNCFDCDVVSANRICQRSRNWGMGNRGPFRTDVVQNNNKICVRDWEDNNTPINGTEVLCVHAGFGKD